MAAELRRCLSGPDFSHSGDLQAFKNELTPTFSVVKLSYCLISHPTPPPHHHHHAHESNDLNIRRFAWLTGFK